MSDKTITGLQTLTAHIIELHAQLVVTTGNRKGEWISGGDQHRAGRVRRTQKAKST